MFGYIPSPEDKRDWKVENIFTSSHLPPKLDLSKDLEPVRDQRTFGTCVAMSLACMKEYQEILDLKITGYLSPMYIYNQRCNKPEKGMHIRDAFKILKEYGIIREAYIRYGDETSPITKEMKELGKLYKIDAYAQVETVEGLKQALYQQGLCIMAFPIYDYDYDGKRMWYKRTPDSKITSLHCVTVSGYDEKKKLEDRVGAFKIRNSWGENWGPYNDGYSWFPYDDFDAIFSLEARLGEVWSSLDSDSGKPSVIFWLKNIFWKIMSQWPLKKIVQWVL